MSSVGVVIAAYNAEQYLASALASVAMQRRPADQVVVVDDGSIDRTAEVARQWSGLLPLTVISLAENGGPGPARRAGVEALGTDLVTLLDSDDVLLPDHLAELSATYQKHGGLVTASGLRWVPGRSLGSEGNADRHPVPPPEKQLERLLLQNFMFIASMFPRAEYERVGGFRSSRGCEDWDLWIRLVVEGVRATGVTVPTVLYRLRPNSVSWADQLLEEELAVLQTFLAEHPGHPASGAAVRSIARRRARLAFRQSYRAAAGGHPWRARQEALAGLRGDPGTSARCLAMVVAPRSVERWRRRLMADPKWLVRQ